MTISNELRIGNWVMNDESGEHVKLMKGADIDSHSTGFSPIVITKEVLGKCGFAFHDHFKIWQKNKAVRGTGPDMELNRDFEVLDFSHKEIGVELKSLHQLQNLYFLMKGKELEIAR
jgi:hypothetical protein